MENNGNKQNRSMFLYTALIFVVALLLIILAFFGQTNLSNLRRKANETTQPIVEETEPPQVSVTPSNNDELARLSNKIAELDAENKKINSEIEIYESLLAANGYVFAGNIAEAKKITEKIESENLTENQKILYEQIQKSINE